MSKPKFTPAPWKIETYHGPMFKIVRDRGPDDVPEHRLTHDARLIECAPELYGALESVLNDKSYKNETGRTVINRLLKKARGG